MLASHDGAAQVDGHDAVECRFADLGERRIAPGNTHAHIVVEHVDAAPPPPRGIGHRRERGVFGHVRLERDAIPAGAAGLPCHRDRFLGGGEIVVDGEHLGAFLNETKYGRTTIAHALARRLACADHDGDFVLKTHGKPRSYRERSCKSGGRKPRILGCCE
jgi:hypothetical protein